MYVCLAMRYMHRHRMYYYVDGNDVRLTIINWQVDHVHYHSLSTWSITKTISLSLPTACVEVGCRTRMARTLLVLSKFYAV